MDQQRLTKLPITLLMLAAACVPVDEGEVDTSLSELTIAGGVMVVMPDDPVRSNIPGCYRCSIGVADFDGDGKQDVVMAGAFDSVFAAGTSAYNTNNVIRLFRNSTSSRGAAIRFAPAGEIAGVRGAGGAVVKVGDFDGDGRQDFAVQFREGASPASDTSAFMNQGGWTFTRRIVTAGFDTNSTSLGMEAADVDRDGRADLIFASDGNGAAPGLWYKWVPASSSWTAQQTGFQHRMTYGGAIAAGDLSGDGYPELVVSGSSNIPFGTYDCTSTTLYGHIHTNRGAGGLGFRSTGRSLGQYALNRGSSTGCTGMVNGGLMIADIDRDGRNDILLAGASDAFRGAPGASSSFFDFVVLRNIDGTGINYSTYENAGAQYAAGTSGGAGSIDSPNMAIGDMTADGLPDVFIQGMRPDHAGNPSTYVPDTRFYVNVGGGRFVELETGFTDVTDGAQAMADFNSDGTIDLIYSGATRASHPNASNNVDTNTSSTLVSRIYRNTLTTPYQGTIPGGTPIPPAPAPDAGTTTPPPPAPDAGTTPPPDAGTTPPPPPPPPAPDAGTTTPPPSGCPSASPLTGGGTSGPVNIAAESGHGLPGCYRCGMDTADFDADGRLDVVMSGPFDSAWTPGMGSYTYENVVRLYRNISCPGQHIRFALQQEISNVSGGGGSIVEVGDFNDDGRPDFAVQFREGESPESDTSSFMNNGSWSFTRRVLPGSFDTNSTSLGMTAADIDRDGLDDLIFLSDAYGEAPGLWYKWSNSSSSWSAQQTDFSHAISYGGTIAAGDLNGDDFPDIVVGGNSNRAFGTTNCASTLMYGHLYMNRGAVASRGINPASANALGRFALRNDRATNMAACTGSDNAGMLIADVDRDGNNDVILAGSSDGFRGPSGMNGSHYDFVVLRNVDGTGANFVTFENAGVQYPLGTTNGGTGNLDNPNIASGDLTGDGYPEIFIQGHHRNYGGDSSGYIFNTRLFLSSGGTSFTELELGLPEVGEGGQAMADFNNDGKVDLIFTGASIAFHSNGSNPTDYNNASTLFTHVYRNTRP